MVLLAHWENNFTFFHCFEGGSHVEFSNFWFFIHHQDEAFFRRFSALFPLPSPLPPSAEVQAPPQGEGGLDLSTWGEGGGEVTHFRFRTGLCAIFPLLCVARGLGRFGAVWGGLGRFGAVQRKNYNKLMSQ